MAQINGIKLTGIKTWSTHDGGGYQANIVVDGKKAGFLHDDGNGGETDIEINADHAEEVASRIKSYFKKNPSEFTTQDIFFEELLNLTENEKEFKKHQKKGFKVFVEFWKAPRHETMNGDYINSPTQVFFGNDSIIGKYMQENNFKDHKVYRNVEDFIIETRE